MRTRSDSESSSEETWRSEENELDSGCEADVSDSDLDCPRYDDEPVHTLFPRYWWNTVTKRYYCDNISCTESGYPQFESICQECGNSHWTFKRWYRWAMEEEKGLFRAIYYYIKST
tara:strand:+ start:54 stop:401 length:348 start_codon:yes stop_codon:yes gene_type:complete